MKNRILLTLISLLIFLLNAFSQEKTIKLFLTYHNGYGYFTPALGGVLQYSTDENDPWKQTYLSVTGVPKNWTEVKFGDIETNIYQTVYQNYLLGNITKEHYENLKKSWGWEPDSLKLSKEPLKTKIAFAYGKDSAGIINMIVDANNNLDLSDDSSFIPYNFSFREKINMDSVVLRNVINVSVEKLVNNKKQLIQVPLFVVYISQYDMFMCNFPQYAIANFEKEKIAVCSDDFVDLSYENCSIVLLSDTLKDGDKISNEKLTAKNEFIEIKGEIYKNIGVDLNSNTLELEKITLPRSELHSTGIGYKSFSFEGKDFMTGRQISSKQLKGKYVLLDFWAVWCAPCQQEISNLKEIYEKVDKEKFEIIGVVGDSSPKSLKEIIKKDSISWPQILSDNTNKLKETFEIDGYPTTFLLNPEGIIVAKNLRGKELEKKVFTLINE